jgi:hypothetical protein
MRTQRTGRPQDAAAELKLRIIQQQEKAAKLARLGKAEAARAAPGKLLIMLNQLDLRRYCEREA